MRLCHLRRRWPAHRPSAGMHVEYINDVEHIASGTIATNDIQTCPDRRPGGVEPSGRAPVDGAPPPIGALPRLLPLQSSRINDAVPFGRRETDQPACDSFAAANDDGHRARLYVAAGPVPCSRAFTARRCVMNFTIPGRMAASPRPADARSREGVADRHLPERRTGRPARLNETLRDEPRVAIRGKDRRNRAADS
jgi:hypothetical protein